MTRFLFLLLLIGPLVSCCHYEQDDPLGCNKRTARNFFNEYDCSNSAYNCPVFERKIDREQELFNYAKSRNSVYFDFDSDRIRGEGVDRVNKMIYELSKLSNAQVLLRGYTDKVGDREYNYRLSLRRANAVKRALVNSRVVIESNIMIEIKGFGEYDPNIPMSAPDNNACSRRVDMYILKCDELQSTPQHRQYQSYDQSCSCNCCR